jgi:hypothetical protein
MPSLKNKHLSVGCEIYPTDENVVSVGLSVGLNRRTLAAPPYSKCDKFAGTY